MSTQSTVQTPFTARSLVTTGGEFLKMPISQREDLLKKFAKRKSLIGVFASAGRGKTNFGLALARSLTTGEFFLNQYEAAGSWDVLYIDGEMADEDSHERITKFMAGSRTALARFHYLSSQGVFEKLGRYLNINTDEDQGIILNILAQMETEACRPEVLFFDNLSCLAPTEENSNTEQEAYLIFFRKLRHMGYTVVFFHHAGKDGKQRGASRREDFCDLFIELAEHPEPEDGRCKFLMQFTKTRGRAPIPSRLLCELHETENGLFTWRTSIPEGKTLKVEQWVVYLKWIADHHPQYQLEIAEAFGVTGAAVSKALNVVRNKKYLDGLDLTEKGREFIKNTYGEQ